MFEPFKLNKMSHHLGGALASYASAHSSSPRTGSKFATTARPRPDIIKTSFDLPRPPRPATDTSVAAFYEALTVILKADMANYKQALITLIS